MGSRPRPRDTRAVRRAVLGAIAGVLAGAAALGVGQLVAGLTGANGSPVVEVGQLQIAHTPPWLKEFAITEFGSDDKLALVTGIIAVLAIFAAAIGVLAVRRLAYGLAGLAIFALIGIFAAVSQPTATAASLLPTLAAVAVAALALRVLVDRVGPPVLSALAEAQPPAGPGGWTGSPAGPDGAGTADDAPAVPDWAPDLPDGVPDLPDLPGGTGGVIRLSGASGPYGPDWRTAVPAGPAPPRRSFLAASAVTAGAAAVAGLAGRLLVERSSVASARAAVRLPAVSPTAVPALPPGVNLGIPGLSPFITPNNDFYRVDTALVLPQVDPTSWQLRIHGMVSREIILTFDELLKRPLIEDYVTLCCVSDPVGGPYIGNALWLGTSLAALLREAGIKAGADQLFCQSVDGFTSGTPVQAVMDDRDALLAVAMNGQALPVAHGFPARMVVPGLYGYVSATKWVTDINVTTFAGNYAYWAQQGWSQQAPIKTESRIDVPNGTSQISAGRTAVAGVAWAQHKGIEAVEVRVDSGPWNQARLAAVPDLDTWRQWVWEWDATSGNHVIEARATDKTGYTQTALQAQPVPNGASGYPSVAVAVG
jgi:DMSO/TMAO reductase YedYZ molybdopterin-dependent catalytic subunit